MEVSSKRGPILVMMIVLVEVVGVRGGGGGDGWRPPSGSLAGRCWVERTRVG